MGPLMAAAKRVRHLQFWFAAALVVIGAVSFSAVSRGATTSISLQVSAVVQNTCSMAVTLPASAPRAVSRNTVKVDCQYGQSYTVNVQPATVDVASDKSAALVSGSTMIVMVTY
jgi:hypothetical protein